MFKHLSGWLDIVTLVAISLYLIFAQEVRPLPMFLFAVVYCNISMRLHERVHHKVGVPETLKKE